VVAALFLRRDKLFDAIADLKQAGFQKDRIRVAFGSAAGIQPLAAAQSVQEHSLGWRLRQGFRQDLHHQGPELAARADQNLSTANESLFSEVNLHDTLQAMGLPETRIQLLNWELGAEGALVLIDAAEREREVSSILERDCGDLRTDTATERIPMGCEPPA
jgi:hypothetical protein